MSEGQSNKPWELEDLKVQFECIRRGGRWKSDGKPCGNGLFWHFRKAQELCWPEDDHHRWSDAVLGGLPGEQKGGILFNDVTVLMGPGDSAKTYTASRWAMIDYWAWPNETLTIVSSTESRGLELRIWGAIKELFNRAKDRFEWLPGNALESQKTITTESIDEDQDRARSIRKGIICVPCVSGGQYVGLGRYVGIKQRRLRHIGDEVQVMRRSFLDAYANWYGKPDFKGILCGNPLEVTDPLGIAAEPPEGWTAMKVPEKTTTWRSRFYNAWVINLVGTDSPNFDYPRGHGIKYPYLISWKKLEAVAATHGKDSLMYSSQCEGVMRPTLQGKRVITKELVREHGGYDNAIWDTTAHTPLYALDPAYGGGDRCVGMPGKFGKGSDGRDILAFGEPEIIPVSVKVDKSPEDQIVEYVKMRMDELGIAYRNGFYDSFGKGTIGFAFARIMGSDSPQPVNSGDKPTARPVRFDLFIQEKDGKKRLKRCDEHYAKFISEMWFSVREALEGSQLREMPEEMVTEMCQRRYMIVQGNKISVEPKDEMVERTGFSPDIGDCGCILMEGARRLGFHIERLGNAQLHVDAGLEALVRDAEEWDSILRSKLLTHA